MRTFSARAEYARLPTNGDDDAYKHEVLRLNFSDDEEAPDPGVLPNEDNCWHFVERTWFQAITAIVIFGNSVTTFYGVAHPDAGEWLRWLEHGMLCFYLFEITARIFAFKRAYFCDTISHVAWNILDIIVVVAGVVDQWILPLLRLPEDSFGRTFLHMLRMLRLMRVLKIVRVFLVSDMSWTETPHFQSLIGAVIVLNSAIMGLEVDIPWKGWLVMEHCLLVVYVFELAVRLKHVGIGFYFPGNPDIVWNVLDSLIVGSSVADSWIAPLYGLVTKAIWGDHSSGEGGGGLSLSKLMMLMRMLRLFRILRLVKLVKAVRPLFILVTSIVSAFQGVVWVLVLTIITLYGMAIITTSLIGHRLAFPEHLEVSEDIVAPFRSVPESMFTLFRVMSSAESEQEAHAIDSVLEALPTLKFAFVFFMITSSWTLLSILTAVVSENMISSTDEQQHAMDLQSEEEDRVAHKDRLAHLFRTIDTDGDGAITQLEIDKFLVTREHRHWASKDTGIPIHSVREVLGTLASVSDDGTIREENFVQYLIDAAKATTERSMMRLQFHVQNLFDKMQESLVEVNEKVQALQEKGLSSTGDVLPSSAARTSHASREGNGHSEHFFEHRMHAHEKYNQQLLAKSEESQKKLIDFLERLERRWLGLEDLSLGLAVDRLACALNGVEPLRSNGELRFNYGTNRNDVVTGHALQSAAARQERTSGQAVHHTPNAIAEPSQGRQPPRDAPQDARSRRGTA